MLAIPFGRIMMIKNFVKKLWKVPVTRRFTVCIGKPYSEAIRSFISFTAFVVNVTSNMAEGGISSRDII